MNQSRIKGILCAVGGFAVLAAGLFYVLVTDLYLLNSSQWLFFGMITALGGGLCCLLSESTRNKKILFYILKGLGVALSIAFIIVVYLYIKSVNYNFIIGERHYTTAKLAQLLNVVIFVSIITTTISIISQAGGIVFNVVYGVDD